MTYTPEGSLAVYGTQTDPPNSAMQFYTTLLDGTDLHVLWEQTLPEIKLSEGDVNNHTDPLEGIDTTLPRYFLRMAANCTLSPQMSRPWLRWIINPEPSSRPRLNPSDLA